MSKKIKKYEKTGASYNQRESSPEMRDGEFRVERILDKRIRKGKVEYYLKWQGFPDSENSWEPIRNLRCPEIIEDFERHHKKMMEEKCYERKQRQEAEAEAHKKVVTGFDRGLKCEKILGATATKKGKIMFLVKWKGINGAELISANIVNQKCPQKVIQYYENHAEFKT